MKFACVLLWVAGLMCSAVAQGIDATEAQAVRATLDAYVEGWYGGDAARVEAATHPELIRRKPALAGTNGAITIESIDQTGFLSATRSGMGKRASAEDRLRGATQVFDIRNVSALALVETGATFSYLQLVRDQGHWRVLSVLWEPKAEPGETRDMSDAAAVEATVRDYAESWYSGDAARMARALSPDLAKRKPVLLGTKGNLRIEELDATAMIAAARAGWGTKTAENKRVKQLKVLDIRGRSAVALLETGEFFDYLALAKNKGHWQIVNVLWEPTLD